MAWYSGLSWGVNKFMGAVDKIGETLLGPKASAALDNVLGITAQKNIEVEREREDTRYQRLQEDLMAAGINPSSVLGGGAVTPSNGVSGSVNSNIGALGSIVSALSNAGLQSKQGDKTQAEIDNIKADTTNKMLDSISKRINNDVMRYTAMEKAVQEVTSGYIDQEQKRAATKLIVEQYRNYAQQTLTEEQRTLETRARALIEAGKFQEAKSVSHFNNFFVNVSESQLVNAGVDAKFFGNGGSQNLSISQSTTHSIPMSWFVGMQDPTISEAQRTKYRMLVETLLIEDIGEMSEQLDSNSKKASEVHKKLKENK